MNDSGHWPNAAFPCHPQHRAEDAILDPLHAERQFAGRCPTCDLSYRLAPRVFRAPGSRFPVVEWTLARGADTVVLPLVFDGIEVSDAPLYQDVPWPSRWPQDPREADLTHDPLPRLTLDHVQRDRYGAVLDRLIADSGWKPSSNRHLFLVTEPATVAGVTLVEPGEVLLGQRGWVHVRTDRVVLVHARSVNYELVLSRGFALVSRPMDDIIIGPPLSEQAPTLFNTEAIGGRL